MVVFNADACTWRIAGIPSEVRASSGRKAIMSAIDDSPEPMSPKEIAEATRQKPGNVRFLLHKMAQDGQVQLDDHGRYTRSGVSKTDNIANADANT